MQLNTSQYFLAFISIQILAVLWACLIGRSPASALGFLESWKISYFLSSLLHSALFPPLFQIAVERSFLLNSCLFFKCPHSRPQNNHFRDLLLSSSPSFLCNIPIWAKAVAYIVIFKSVFLNHASCSRNYRNQVEIISTMQMASTLLIPFSAWWRTSGVSGICCLGTTMLITFWIGPFCYLMLGSIYLQDRKIFGGIQVSFFTPSSLYVILLLSILGIQPRQKDYSHFSKDLLSFLQSTQLMLIHTFISCCHVNMLCGVFFF